MKVLLIPLLAAIAEPANMIIAKISLTRIRISIRDYMPGSFVFLTLCSALSLVKLGHFSTFHMTGNGILKLGAIIVVASVWNVLYYKGLSKEKLNTTEGITILMPLATIALSWLFVPTSFNVHIAVTASLATAIIIWTYRSKNIFRPDRYSIMLAVAVILIALEDNLVSQVLTENSISPALLYTIRVSVISVIMYMIYRPSLRKLKPKSLFVLALTGAIGTTTMLLLYYGLRDAGVVATAFIYILVPVLVLFSAHKYLHEKIKPSRLLAMTAVCSLILFAMLTNYSQISNK